MGKVVILKNGRELEIQDPEKKCRLFKLEGRKYGMIFGDKMYKLTEKGRNGMRGKEVRFEYSDQKDLPCIGMSKAKKCKYYVFEGEGCGIYYCENNGIFLDGHILRWHR